MIALGQLTIALAVVGWYFTKEKDKITNTNVFWAFNTTCRYHLGTIAFGALIIALIETMRAFLTYLQVNPYYYHSSTSSSSSSSSTSSS